MPVIIDEVVISIESGNQAPDSRSRISGQSAAEEKQQIVNECVEQVLEILQQKEER
jgi:hypothetical protein